MSLSKLQTEQKLEQLCVIMFQAVQKDNWYKVKEADKQIQLLFSYAKSMPWFSSMNIQPEQLQKRYKDVIKQIGDKQSEIKIKMQRHQNDKDGIEAYKALSEDTSI